jgi:hypothetical protein
VPAGVAAPEGKRGARLGIHGDRAARKIMGLEATLVDHTEMAIAALDPADARVIVAKVASVAALLIAKAYKIHDRVVSGRTDRLSDTDASDCFRIMQSTTPADVAATLATLASDPIAGPTSVDGVDHLHDLFGRRGRPGVAMASRALRLALSEAQVEAICVAYIAALTARPDDRRS